MKVTRTPITFESYFRRQSIKWSLISLTLMFALAIPYLAYMTKLNAEQHASEDARVATHAFREKILEGGVRDAQFQIRKVLSLTEGESVIIRDSQLQAIYPIEESDKKSHFEAPGTASWAPRFETVSVLSPVYFGDKSTLFGYLELTRKPHVNWLLLTLLAISILVAFTVQSFGLASAVQYCARAVKKSLESWSRHVVQRGAISDDDSDSELFGEFLPVANVVANLKSEIERLREAAAQQAKEKAQYSILREITHDLKTPLSQLSKYHLILFDRLRNSHQIEENEVSRIERALSRASNLVKQVNLRHTTAHGPINLVPWNVAIETMSIVADLQHLAEINRKGIALELAIEEDTPNVSMSKTEFYQILENLVRNAAEAISGSNGKITVSLFGSRSKAVLHVLDNGPGIPESIQTKIFDFDFTTKVGQGTGIGLGIVRRICDQHKADVTFFSNPTGTLFSITFPNDTSSGLTTFRQYEESEQYEPNQA